jgi:hypothetical protein
MLEHQDQQEHHLGNVSDPLWLWLLLLVLVLGQHLLLLLLGC